MPAIGIAALVAVMLAAAPALGAALALVLAVDVSASVTADSYVLQHDGIARAFANSRLVEAITAAPGGIEVLVLEWSDPDKIAVAVDWQRVTDGTSARAFVAAVRASGRSSNGLTAIGPALLAAAAAFERLPEPAARRVIDLSGDFRLRDAAAYEHYYEGAMGWPISVCRRQRRATESWRPEFRSMGWPS